MIAYDSKDDIYDDENQEIITDRRRIHWKTSWKDDRASKHHDEG